jgi:hypothetical protein
MTTAQGLRKIAVREWTAGHVITVQGFRVGVRFRRPYLKDSLQSWLDSEPDSELAHKLYVIGMNSRDPGRGHGYVELNSKWVSTMYVNSRGFGRLALDFTPELTDEIRKWLRRECEMRITDLIKELEDALVDARHAGDSVDELVKVSKTEAAFGLCLEELGGAEAFGKWARAFLTCRKPRPGIMPSFI